MSRVRAGLQGARRGAAFLTTVILLLVACTVAVAVVAATLTSAANSTARTDQAVADRIARDLAAQFDAQLAKDPQFWARTLFFAERPRVCAATGATVVASGNPAATPVTWPAQCGTRWTYVPAGTTVPGYDPTQQVVRAEVIPPDNGDGLLHLRVLASIGNVEAALERTWAIPSAAQVTLYSQAGVGMDTLAGPTGTVSVQGTVYTVAASSTPTRPEQTDPTTGAGALTGARLASECGISGPADGALAYWRALSSADRAAAGCTDPVADTLTPADVRTLAPSPLTVDQAARSAAQLAQRACPATTPSLVDVGQPAVTRTTSLCLHAGATLVDVNGAQVSVSAPGGTPPTAYRIQLQGTASAPTVAVDVAGGTLSEDPGAYAAGSHPMSDTGPVWSTLGVFPAPVTGLIDTDQTTYVARCTISLGGSVCAASTAAADLTIVAGTPSVPRELVVAGPVGTDGVAHLGLVATGQLRVASYARAASDLTLTASLFALGAGTNSTTPSVVTEPGAAGTTGTLHVIGSLGGARVGDLSGWSRVQLSAGEGPASFVTFTPFWRVQSTATLTGMQLCGQLECSDVW